jgi:hypothetical protein
VKINIVVSDNKTARIIAISKNVGFTVIADDANIIEPCDFAKLGMLEYSDGTLDE